MLGQEPCVHLGLGIRAQMNTPFLGHVEAMLCLRWVYVGTYLWALASFTICLALFCYLGLKNNLGHDSRTKVLVTMPMELHFVINKW